jgi:hypothetical protein
MESEGYFFEKGNKIGDRFLEDVAVSVDVVL